jgi:hypothetical protein
MDETPLAGGRVTEGVVRVGDTVRRPTKTSSPFVRDLLCYLEAHGFDGAPRYLGVDECGRQVFSYLEGDVPSELDAQLSDEVLVEAASLIRRFHDATAGSALAGEHETVCHRDLSSSTASDRSRSSTSMLRHPEAASKTSATPSSSR